MTKPQLRECPGCGLFQIVPAMAPGLRSNCTRCGTVLRITRVDPLNRHLALTFAAMVLFTVVWMAMLMKVSTAGIVRETVLESGPRELVARGLWPLAIAVAFTTAYAPLGKFLATLYVLIGLQDAAPAAQDARTSSCCHAGSTPGACWKCCCSACSWPTPSSATW